MVRRRLPVALSPVILIINDVYGPDLASGGNNLIGNGDHTPAFVDRINGDIVGF